MNQENDQITFGTGTSVFPSFKKKEEKSIQLITDWIHQSNGQVCASISGGKDSLVMADLIRRVYPDCPLLWVNQGHLADWKGCVKLLSYLREDKGWNIIELCPPLGLIQLYKKYGMTFERCFNALDYKHCQELLTKPTKEWIELNNIEGHAWGLRRESTRRSIYLSKYKLLQRRKDGILVCSPVGYWTITDIWAYIDHYRLPYAQIYDVEGRFSFRNSPPIDTALSAWGKLANLRRKYPEIYFELENIFPEIRNHV